MNQYRTIIAGTRKMAHAEALVGLAVERCGWEISEYVSGHSGDVDMAGETHAKLRGQQPTLFEAKWETHGKRAGPYRNEEMAQWAAALIAIWDRKSPGTLDMIQRAIAHNLTYMVISTDELETGIITVRFGKAPFPGQRWVVCL